MPKKKKNSEDFIKKVAQSVKKETMKRKAMAIPGKKGSTDEWNYYFEKGGPKPKTPLTAYQKEKWAERLTTKEKR